MQSKSSIRLTLRHKRRQLNHQSQKLAARQIAQQLSTFSILSTAKHIAIYWPNDGEISPLLYYQQKKHSAKHFYLPKILSSGKLSFSLLTSLRKLAKNKYGIAESIRKKRFNPNKLDAVLMPLVAFDNKGNRLGMGGGYYDKTFAFKRKKLWCKKTKLIGLAHDFQEVSQIHHDSWDIPFDAIVTNKRIINVFHTS